MLLNIPINLKLSEITPGFNSIQIEIPAGAVKSDLTGFPLKVDLSRMPEDFWTNVRSDGGNLRAYQADGITMIPHDLTFIDKEKQKGSFYIKTDLLTASDNIVVIGILDSSTTKLAATDVNGRNAVWNDYEVVVVFPEKINRVDGSSPTVNPTLPPVYDWVEVDSISTYGNQGIVFDGTNYFASQTDRLWKLDIYGSNVTYILPINALRTATGDSSLNHLGALSIIDDELWIPVQQYPATTYDSQFIARYAKSDLSLIGVFQLTGATRESSGVHYDAALDRLYVTDFTVHDNIPYFSKSTGVYEGQLALSSNIVNMQGMTELNGKYYVNSKSDGVYEVEKDGTVNGVVFDSQWSNDSESVYAYGGKLLAFETGRATWWEKGADRADWGAFYNTPMSFQVPKSTIWSVGADWVPRPTAPTQAIIGVASVADPSGDRHLIGYNNVAGGGFGMWNATDLWTYPSPDVYWSRRYSSYRLALAQNDTAGRKMRVNHLKNAVLSSAAIPASSGDMQFNIGHSGGLSQAQGFIQFAWLRNEYMGDAWLEADYENAKQEESFYHILPHPVSPFPENYTFLSTVNYLSGGREADWVLETPSFTFGDLNGSDRWILGTDAQKFKAYQKKRIRSTQFAAVDAGNAYVSFTSDLTTFTGDTDWVMAFVEFYDQQGNFLSRANSVVVSTDPGPSAGPNIVSTTDKLVPPGTRTMHFGWHAGRETGSELSAYVKDYSAQLDTVEGHVSAAVVWAENEPTSDGWVATAGSFSMVTANNDASVPPGSGNHGYYYGGSVARTTYYKDFALPAGWSEKIAGGNVSFMFRALTFNINDDDDVGIRVSFLGSASGVVDTGLPVTISVPIPWELTGPVPPDATGIRIQFDFRRQDGTANDGGLGQPSLLLMEAPDPYLDFVEFLQNEWAEPLTTAQYPSGQTFSQIGTPAVSTTTLHAGLDTLALDGTNALILDNTSPKLSIANTTDFCFEAWVYCTNLGVVNTIFNKRDGTGAEEFTFVVNASKFEFATLRSGNVHRSILSDAVITANTWYHVAVVRQSQQLRMYVNGVAQIDVKTETDGPSANLQNVFIGNDGYNSTRRWRGNFGPMRITFGNCRYTANFIPARIFPTV